jgi:hypothetical protein
MGTDESPGSHALSLEKKLEKNSRPKPWYGGSNSSIFAHAIVVLS